MNYIQATNYMKGHAGIVVTGANVDSNLTIFSVGRGNAVNQGLFRSDVTYDGFADLASRSGHRDRKRPRPAGSRSGGHRLVLPHLRLGVFTRFRR